MWAWDCSSLISVSMLGLILLFSLGLLMCVTFELNNFLSVQSHEKQITLNVHWHLIILCRSGCVDLSYGFTVWFLMIVGRLLLGNQMDIVRYTCNNLSTDVWGRLVHSCEALHLAQSNDVDYLLSHVHSYFRIFLHYHALIAFTKSTFSKPSPSFLCFHI